MECRVAQDGSMALKKPSPCAGDNRVSINLLDAIRLHFSGWVSVTVAVNLMGVGKLHHGRLGCQWFLIWTCQADHTPGLLHVIGPCLGESESLVVDRLGMY